MPILDKIEKIIESKPTTKPECSEKKATVENSATQMLSKMAMIKAAAEIQRLEDLNVQLEKHARATEIAYRLLRDEQISIDEFPEKVAELKTKDLRLVEEAMKLAYKNDMTRIGDVDKGADSDYSTSDPLTSAILGS